MRLFELPNSEQCTVLSTLALVDLVRLDTALCNHKIRANWSEVIQAKGFILRTHIQVWNNAEMAWLLAKSVRASNIDVKPVVYGPPVSEYLRLYGSSIRSVHFMGSLGSEAEKSSTILLIALYCQHVNSVRFIGDVILGAYKELLWRNPSIRKIWFDKTSGVLPQVSNVFAGLSLHHLEVLRFETVGKEQSYLWDKTAYSDSLHTVVYKSDSYNLDFGALLCNCLVTSLIVALRDC